MVGVLLCSASFLHSLMHAEHEETPVLVSFRALCLSCVPEGFGPFVNYYLYIIID